MNKLNYLLFAGALSAGCTLMPSETMHMKKEMVAEHRAKELSTYEKKPLVNNVNQYTKWLIQDLFSNVDSPDNSHVIAVANFALLDSDLKRTNHFGRQLNEAIMHETNRTGYSVVDLKSTGRLQFTDKGDIFWHSEQIDEVTGNLDINFVITGTMTRHQGGYLINARIIDVNTNALMSSSQILVPNDVVDAVLKEDDNEHKGFPIIASGDSL
ncbi:FlgO family outer membrane protein [Psychrobium sp. nBUS_13]|jgi:TolB-like protein|uniref:FlgO family outer membrane protein n=1 Tax=Psychrobium sp. nBUS_13 TaxID=3395319 RepID=UPI003EBEBF50